MKRKDAIQLRTILDSVVSAIPMCSEAEFNASAAAINENAAAIRVWVAGRSYNRTDIRIDPADSVPYWALHTHSSVEGAELQPSLTPTIWTHCHGTTPETARPFVAEGHNPYMAGHYCTENGAVFVCLDNNTVHAPSVLPTAWEKCSV